MDGCLIICIIELAEIGVKVCWILSTGTAVCHHKVCQIISICCDLVLWTFMSAQMHTLNLIIAPSIYNRTVVVNFNFMKKWSRDITMAMTNDDWLSNTCSEYVTFIEKFNGTNNVGPGNNIIQYQVVTSSWAWYR